MRQLTAAGADLAKRDDWHLPPRNWTPLHYAAASGDVAVVDTLIRAGADPRAVDYSGWTPMIVALAKRHIEAANVLKKWQSLPGIVSVNHDGQMNFEVIGVDGTQCDIEASVDLKKWSRVDPGDTRKRPGQFSGCPPYLAAPLLLPGQGGGVVSGRLQPRLPHRPGERQRREQHQR